MVRVGERGRRGRGREGNQQSEHQNFKSKKPDLKPRFLEQVLKFFISQKSLVSMNMNWYYEFWSRRNDMSQLMPGISKVPHDVQ